MRTHLLRIVLSTFSCVLLINGILLAQQQETINKIRKKVESGEPFKLTNDEREVLKKHIAYKELSSFASFLKKNTDLNSNGSTDAAEQQFRNALFEQAKYHFQHAWKGIEQGEKTIKNIPDQTAQNKSSRGINRAGGNLERALQKAHHAMKTAGNDSRGKQNRDSNDGKPSLSPFEKAFDTNQDDTLEPAEKQNMKQYLATHPIQKFAQSLREKFLRRKEDLLAMDKGKNMKTNPINTFARSLRQEFLSRVADQAEQVLHGADANENGNIDQGETERLSRQIQKHMPSHASKGKRHKQFGDERARSGRHDHPGSKSGRPSGEGNRPGGRGGGPGGVPGKRGGPGGGPGR